MLRAGRNFSAGEAIGCPGGGARSAGSSATRSAARPHGAAGPVFRFPDRNRERHPQVKMRLNLGHESAADPGAAGKKTGRAGGK